MKAVHIVRRNKTAPPAEHRRARYQKGAAAIEFAFLFVIFFGVLYAVMSYSFVMLLQQGLVHASAEGARSVIRIDRLTTPNFEATARARADLVAKNALSWLPPNLYNRVIVVTDWPANLGGAVRVTVTYPNYAQAPFIPPLELPGLGTVPQTPQNLVARAILTP